MKFISQECLIKCFQRSQNIFSSSFISTSSKINLLQMFITLSQNYIFLNASSLCCFSNRLIHGGQLLNGLAGPTIMSAGPYLSTTWFAPDQRATATAVASLFSYLGGATSFIVGPLVVPAPNDTQAATATVSDSTIRDRIQLVMYAGTYRKAGHNLSGLCKDQ